MQKFVRRRDVVVGGLSLGIAAAGGAWNGARAATKPVLQGVTWGGPWLKASQEAVAKQNAVTVHWSLHEGPTIAIVAKIKASWPNPQYDFVVASGPPLYSMLNEGWLEPLSPTAIPNILKLDSSTLIKNDKGEIMSATLDLSGMFWIADEGALGMKIEKPNDLLAPKVKGKLLLTPPSVASGRQLVSLALGWGGDERHIDPGFEFAKALAKAKAVGSMAKTDVDIVNAFTTGMVAVGMVNVDNYAQIKKVKNVRLLNKVPGSRMFKHYVGYEALGMLKRNGDRKPVTDFINFFIDAPINGPYAASIGAIPGNVEAKVDPRLDPIRLVNEAERKAFAFYPDLAYAARETAEWSRRWELEVMPLLT